MNEIINEGNFFTKFLNILKKNSKYVFILICLFILTFGAIQFYYFNLNNKILESSIDYDYFKNNPNNGNFEDNLKKLSLEKNFYGTLATLEKIRTIITKDHELAFNDYINLLEGKRLKNYYNAAISIHGSYLFLEKINYLVDNNKLTKEIFLDLSIKINKLLEYVDISLDAYQGFKLEILFLLSILELDMLNNKEADQKTENLYIQIRDNDKISSSLKDRVKKIHEFQKYK